ncbi:MAG: phosphate ABC transporter permease PstA [Pseudomonadales bacterium]|uniref:Phosphate transport system permease protein PstA n=1 Tax=Oleiphilus messinensis TaxID=141451 RepID=A0A1Y0I495_9GAMM|nr:phosphate ABC transporter permease PstA [Oleiphilus messinensis]ARU54606.1 phosphate ABC transporter permease [Oleiphilus messinensis]MCG8612053.1 phosphate ABC transporter permease PstA [Pseudomonadales bacterium]
MNTARVYDRCATVVLWVTAVAFLLLPGWIMLEMVSTGWNHLDFEFLFSSPVDSGRQGGIAPIVVSTGLILICCMAAVLPVGLGCALYLSEKVEMETKLAFRTRQALDVLSGVPSIVYGLFGYVFFAQVLQLGFSILSGGLTLACMVLPLFIRLSEQALRSVPYRYRQAANALNLSQFAYVRKIALPVAAQGIASAFIVATGRALAETAVLIFTAGYVARYPGSIMDSGRSLSVHIYDLAMNVPGGSEPAAATALVLIALLIAINWLARRLASGFPVARLPLKRLLGR